MKDINDAQTLSGNQLESFLLRGTLMVNLEQFAKFVMALMKRNHLSPSV
jgi:hypothetical protein